jgi:addiction module HigA family antidote
MNPPITPGEILLEKYFEPMGISQNAMARAIGVAPWAINEIEHGKRSITPQMSIRFGPSSGNRRISGTASRWSATAVRCVTVPSNSPKTYRRRKP